MCQCLNESMSKLRIPAMLLLFTSAALLEAVRLSSLTALSNGDTWGHLSAGLWIIQNHGLPTNGIFSQSAALPWVDSSWAYDVVLAVLYKLLALRAVPFVLMGFKVKLAVITFFLAGGLRGRFWPAIALSAIGQYILGGLQPGPTYCSALFFAMELVLLIESRKAGNAKLLFWLPPMFLMWANFDVQFVYGLGLLLLFLGTLVLGSLISRYGIPQLPSDHETVSLGTVAIVTVISMFATVVTPYFYRPCQVFFSSITSAANLYLPDFHAMNFHQPQDYILMLLAMAAFLALGLRRSRDPFQISLLIGCTMLSFYAQRNNWLATLAAVAVIAEAMPAALKTAPSASKSCGRRFIITITLTAVVILLAVLQIPRSREVLLGKIARTYPVQASDYIRAHHLPQPLFNAFEWGGFLTWYLPEYPVAIDGRTNLYGDEFMVQYSKLMNADVPYKAFPPANDARTLLLQSDSIIGEAMSTLPGFKVAYSDKVAVVLTKEDE
jgi:hypothetical protein